MRGTIATARGWPAAILVALLSLACFAAASVHLVQHAPSYDELLHVLSARGVNATGEPAIQDGTYDRAEIYTRLVARVSNHMSDELVAARVPAWVSAALLIVLLVLWTSRLFGPLAGLSAGVLLAFCRLTIDMSVFARFYTLHALLVLIAFICLYAAAARGRRIFAVGLLIAAALVALDLGWNLQGITAISGGAMGAGIVAGLIAERRKEAFPLLRRHAIPLIVIVAAGVAALYWVLTHFDLMRLFTESALWAAHASRRYNLYNQMMGEELPLFWPLIPFAFVAVALRNARLAWSLFATIVIAILLQSLAAQKATRYIYYCLPLICALLGCGIALAFEAMRDFAVQRWPAHPQLAKALPIVLIGSSLLASTELYRYARAAVTHDPPESVLSYGAESSWEAAKKPLAPYLAAKPSLVTSNSMKAIYYFGWYDAELNASIVGETDTRTELGLDERTGRRAFSTAASLDHVLAEAESTLILAETDKLGLDRGVPRETVSEIERRCRPIALPEETRLSAWTCQRSAGAAPERPQT